MKLLRKSAGKCFLTLLSPYSPDVVRSNLEFFRTSEETIEANKVEHDKQVRQVYASLIV
jgi:hypothetical protein